jgi:hypothetical protein
MRFCLGELSPKKRRNCGSSNSGWRFVDDFGGVQVDHRRRGDGHRVGIGHRALLHTGGLRGLLQVDVEARQPDPLRVTLNNQQSDKHAGQQRPAKKRSALSIKHVLKGCRPADRP